MGLPAAEQSPREVLQLRGYRSGVPRFLLVTEVSSQDPAWSELEMCRRAVGDAFAAIVGFTTVVEAVTMDEDLGGSIAAAGEGASELFILPLSLEFDLLQREALGRAISEARRRHPELAIHHDDIDPSDSLIVDSLAAQTMKTVGEAGADPRHAGLVFAAVGEGGASSRAQSYRAMRLVWERLGLAAGEIGFLRHDRPFLQFTLEKCERAGMDWIVVPQTLWKSQYFDYIEVILQNFQKSHPAAARWRLAHPPGSNPAVTAWLTRRISRLWNEKRAREQTRRMSHKSQPGPDRQVAAARIGKGIIASVSDHAGMSRALNQLLDGRRAERFVVKVTWHGYATGTYTDPAALDLLLGALPSPAIIVEGHTSSRTRDTAAFDWETEARANRAWIRQQDAEYLRRTGLADVISRHKAQYINVTEAFWDENCASPQDIVQILRQKGVILHHPELTQIVPRILVENTGCAMISFAKFKGPTRLSIANMFGLLPEPLRAAWHGPNITYMARVCCDLVKLYGALFDLYSINEALYTAVRWNRKGLYRSRWGNYDLVEDSGYLTASRGAVSADILASRLQGQEVTRSAFFDVVRAELGWDEAAATELLPTAIQALFA